MHRYFLLISVVVVLFVPLSASAIDLGGDRAGRAAGAAGYDPATELTLSQTIGSLVRVALSLIGVIFMLLMVYAGFLWMTARGKEEQIEKAQDIIRAAIIGLIITTGAYSITAFVVPRIVSRTGGQSSTPTTPTTPTTACCWDVSGGSGGQEGMTSQQCQNQCAAGSGRSNCRIITGRSSDC